MKSQYRNSAHDRQESPITDQAAAWLATLSDSTCSTAEREAFVAWVKRSNLHVEEFLRISGLMHRLSGAPLWAAVNLEELIASAKSTVHALDLSPARQMSTMGSQPKPSRKRRVWLAAAVVFLTVGIASILTLWGRLDVRGEIYTTDLGELRSITLSDGSIVELNTQSKLRAHFGARERRIQLLQGEAVFKVTKDSVRPFHVFTGQANITVLGTQFNVRSSQRRTIVTVLEGRVRVAGKGAETAQKMDRRDTSLPSGSSPSVELTQGEQVVVETNRALAHTARVDARKVTGWTARRLYFEDTPLTEVVAEFARYNTRSIDIDDPRLAQRRITATFDSSDPAALIEFLKRYSDTVIQETSEGWTLGGSFSGSSALR